MKAKKEVGTELVQRDTNKRCTIIEMNDTKFVVRFEDGKEGTYSMGSLSSKFVVYDAGTKISKDEYNKLLEQYNKVVNENEDLKARLKILEDNNKKLTAIINTTHAGGRPKKFEDSLLDEIIKYRKQGESYRQLAKRFNCSVSYICQKLKNNQDKLLEEDFKSENLD